MGWEELPVPIHRDGKGLVSEMCLYVLVVEALVDQEARAGVSQAVDPCIRETRGLQGWSPRATNEALMPERLATSRRKDQCVR